MTTQKPVNVKRSALKKGGTWAGIATALVGIGQSGFLHGYWGAAATVIGTLIGAIGAPAASYVDAKKANTAQGTR